MPINLYIVVVFRSMIVLYDFGIIYLQAVPFIAFNYSIGNCLQNDIFIIILYRYDNTFKLAICAKKVPKGFMIFIVAMQRSSST